MTTPFMNSEQATVFLIGMAIFAGFFHLVYIVLCFRAWFRARHNRNQEDSRIV